MDFFPLLGFDNFESLLAGAHWMVSVGCPFQISSSLRAVSKEMGGRLISKVQLPVSSSMMLK